jgi:hypothetical protein
MEQPNNSPVAPSTPTFTTLPEYYQFFYGEVYNKLSKAEQARLDENLRKPKQLLHGKEEDFPNVKAFVTEVCTKAETAYDKMVKDKGVSPA